MYGYETYEDSSSDDEGSGPVWEDLLPSLYIPKHVEIEIFVVRLQNSYEPIGMKNYEYATVHIISYD